MKIALVSPYDFQYPGGVNNHIHYLSIALRRRKVDVYLIAPNLKTGSNLYNRLPLRGRLTTISSGGSKARVNLDPRVIWQIRKLLKRHRFDVVHLHNPLSLLISIGFLLNRAVAPGSTFVATFHEYRSTPNPSIEMGKPFLQRLVNRLDGRIVVSEAALAFNMTCFPGDYAIIPNGIDIQRFTPLNNHAGQEPLPEAPIILFVGRLELRKGFPYLLQAFARVRQHFRKARLLVVGPFHVNTAMVRNRFSAQYDLQGVDFLGQVPDTALPQLYRNADIFCAPSVDYESFGIVLLEAMASGTPVVASDIPGYRTVVQHGKQGLLVAPKSPRAIAKGIVQLLQDNVRRHQMRRAAKARAAAFDWEVITDDILSFYHRTIDH